MNITWQSPIGGDNILQYIVTVTNHSSELKTVNEPHIAEKNNYSVNVGDLAAGVVYSIEIRAMNDAGYGPSFQTSQCTSMLSILQYF